MTMITPSYLGETIEYSSLHACRSTLEDPTRWFLEQGRLAAPENGELLRALARLHEHLQHWKPAIALWQYVIELEPANDEARRKVTELSAQEMLAVYENRRE